VLISLAALIALGSCSKRGKPSAEFTQAHAMFARIYGEKLDEAFDDSRMEMVEQLLAKVPADSSDAAAAHELSQRITAGRAQAQAEAKKRSEALAAARTPVQVPPSSFPRTSPTEMDAGAPTVDAGPPLNPSPGMPYAQFIELFSGCFRQRNSILVEGRGMREAWELKDIANCRDRHPGFEDMIVIIDENLILTTVRKDSIKMVVADGGAK
jgi:hypothetical protein